MTTKEFNMKKEVLEKEFKRAKKALAVEYALANNPVAIGDMVVDHSGSVKVDKIGIAGIDDPCCVYYGVEYTKKGVPYKNGSRRGVYQTNIKS